MERAPLRSLSEFHKLGEGLGASAYAHEATLPAAPMRGQAGNHLSHPLKWVRSMRIQRWLFPHMGFERTDRQELWISCRQVFDQYRLLLGIQFGAFAHHAHNRLLPRFCGLGCVCHTA